MSASRFAPRPLTITLLLALTPTAFAQSMPPAVGPAEATKPGDSEPQLLDAVRVKGSSYLPYRVTESRTATRTDTPLVNVPQAATVVTKELIRDQAMGSIGDVLRYVPGAGVAQGEGNRDNPVMRGNATTGDFFVDGVRDDVQYIRDLYNIERVEVLKGPNAMVFGRGGSGGIVNRVSKIADGSEGGEAVLQLGNWDRKRGTIDWQAPVGSHAAFRINAMAEESGSFRHGFSLSRRGINPTVHVDFDNGDRLDLSAEHFRDDRVADRGVTSWQGRPLDVDPSTFLGNPEQSPVRARVNALDAVYAHAFGGTVEVRNHLRYADYDKSYQNVFGNGTSRTADGRVMITLSAYSNATQRRNVFNQTDLVAHATTGALKHTLLAGIELGQQDTDNLRRTGQFAAGAVVPLEAPRYTGTVVFARASTDAWNTGTARTTGLYVQDQVELGSPRWQAIVGVRHDDFRLAMTDLRDGAVYRSNDNVWSPRGGLVWKPRDDMSVYGSYSVAFQPRGGDQLASLSASNQSLVPEKFVNREVGFKWELGQKLSLTTAVFRLDRSHVAVADPNRPGVLVLVDGQQSRGVELGIAGRLTDHWQVMGGYARQEGEITATQSPTAPKGNRLAQLPRHSASMWNRYDFSSRFGLGLGAIYRSAIYPSTDNTVTVPGFVRWDAAAYWTVNPTLQLQLNVENLFDTTYFASANSNNNISPGAPRGVMLTARVSF